MKGFQEWDQRFSKVVEVAKNCDQGVITEVRVRGAELNILEMKILKLKECCWGSCSLFWSKSEELADLVRLLKRGQPSRAAAESLEKSKSWRVLWEQSPAYAFYSDLWELQFASVAKM